MKFGVVVFPGSNCDRDMIDALQNDLQQEVLVLWHKDKDISMFTTDDCIVFLRRVQLRGLRAVAPLPGLAL